MAKEPTQQRKSTEDTSSTLQRNPSASLQPTRRSSNTNTEARHSQRRAFNTSTTSSVQVGVSGSDQNANMRRTSSVSDIPIPITYTPTTHRISKAKKGKRVHACEFPGCNKVFTRAEHRRRHELNHNPEASFPCTYEGCRKAFHRPDLLARHMERHELDAQTDENAAQRWKQASVTSDPPNVVNPVPIDANTGSFPATSAQSSSMSINSIVAAPGVRPDLAGDYSLPWNGTEMPLHPRAHMFPGYIRDSTDDSPLYSSPETCASPSSDVPSFQLPTYPTPRPSAPTSVMEQYPKSAFNMDLTGSPLPIHSTTRDWDPLEANVPAPNVIPISLDGDVLQSVGEPSHGCQPLGIRTNAQQDSPVPIPLSNLDGDEWFSLRRELNSAPGVISGNDGMEIVDTVTWKDCFECYWQHFHPLFPIVHRPTFFATKPSPLMAGAMVAIGSQYDTRQNAKEYSLALLEACQKLLSKRIPITSRSRVTDIQTVFLLELLSKFRSRRADVQISHRFRSLYGSFTQDRHWVSQNPLAVFNTLPPNPSHEALNNAYKFWVEHEARRRVLQAAFILDTQQSALFGQQPVMLQQAFGDAKTRNFPQRTIDLPFPCDSQLWETWQLGDWYRLARNFKPCSLSSVAATLGTPGGPDTGPLDSFQTTLLLAYNISSQAQHRDLEGSLGRFAQVLEGMLDVADGQSILRPSTSFSPHSCTLFTYHALLAARHTPVQALLTVSGESWLFNRKLPREEDFRTAKRVLREWASDTENARKAVWHAVRVLGYAVSGDPDPAVQFTGQNQPHVGILAGLSGRGTGYGYDISGSQPVPTTAGLDGIFPGTRGATATATATSSPLTMLHSNWALYTSALICWAYGFDLSVSDEVPDSNDSHQQQNWPFVTTSDSARSYVSAMISLAPTTWEQLSHATIPTTVRCNTRPLVEFVRTRRLQEGRMGGLLNEGERVLARLAERKRGMWDF